MITLHPIVTRIKEEIPDLKVNAWYVDDGTLCGSPGDLARALGIIKEEGSLRGLTLNRKMTYTFPRCRPF